jgi:hypothetical protein
LDYFLSAGRRVVEVKADNDPPERIYQKICQALESHDRTENRV